VKIIRNNKIYFSEMSKPSFYSIKRQFDLIGYENIYSNEFCHKFLSDEISQDFDLDFKFKTHGELIYKI
jgi:hypothetical protein